MLGTQTITRLDRINRLEAESIHFFREAASEFRIPVTLYSMGKDNPVFLHFLLKAFYPENRRSRCHTWIPLGGFAR